MKRSFTCASLAVVLLASAPIAAQAEPGGCLKYGAVGAVGGHVAGRHGVLGAIGGCVTGMYVRHKYRKNLQADAQKWRDQQAGQKAGSQPRPQTSGKNGFPAGQNELM